MKVAAVPNQALMIAPHRGCMRACAQVVALGRAGVGVAPEHAPRGHVQASRPTPAACSGLLPNNFACSEIAARPYSRVRAAVFPLTVTGRRPRFCKAPLCLSRYSADLQQ